jgi:hypothetical protein
LYAQNLGGAVLTAGLVVGGNFGPGGATVQGLAFNVTDPSTTFQDGELNVWGASGNNTSVLDTTFVGNRSIGVGLLVLNPNGLVAQRLTFSAFTDEGIRASDNVAVAYGSPTPVLNTITDISVNGVGRSTPGASGGTAESGIFIGEPVANGVNRVAISNCSWSGIETTNNSWNTTFSNLTINMTGPNAVTGIAVYLEHFSLNDTFTNFNITGSKAGFYAEWNDGTVGNEAAQNDTFENGTIDASGWSLGGNEAGIYLDEGTGPTTVTNVAFKNQNWAGIGTYKNVSPNLVINNSYALAAGGVDLSVSHI